jgi:hypothetical protein
MFCALETFPPHQPTGTEERLSKFRQNYSGGVVGARVQLEVAHKWDDVASRTDSPAAGAGRRVAAHCLDALSFMTLRRDPCRMGLEENNRRS